MFKKSDIRTFKYRNRFLIRNGDHIGIYKYIDGWMLLKKQLTKGSEGYNVVYKVYDSYEDKINNTLLRFSEHEPSNTLLDLMMVSEVYPIPLYIKNSNEDDMEALQTAINSDGDFYEILLKIIHKQMLA